MTYVLVSLTPVSITFYQSYGYQILCCAFLFIVVFQYEGCFLLCVYATGRDFEEQGLCRSNGLSTHVISHNHFTCGLGFHRDFLH